MHDMLFDIDMGRRYVISSLRVRGHGRPYVLCVDGYGLYWY